jgi:hypothetical protein
VINSVLLDTGPLVAFLNRHDDAHEWAVARFKEIEPPFLTCEAVLSETIHLLQGRAVVLEHLEKFLVAGFIRVDFSFADVARGWLSGADVGIASEFSGLHVGHGFPHLPQAWPAGHPGPPAAGQGVVESRAATRPYHSRSFACFAGQDSRLAPGNAHLTNCRRF